MSKWVTLEIVPRILTVKGRSGIDPDCLVAYLDVDDGKPLWIVEGSNPDRCYVCGLGVYASPIEIVC